MSFSFQTTTGVGETSMLKRQAELPYNPDAGVGIAHIGGLLVFEKIRC